MRVRYRADFCNFKRNNFENEAKPGRHFGLISKNLHHKTFVSYEKHDPSAKVMNLDKYGHP